MSVTHGFYGKPYDYSWKDVKVREYGDEFEGVTRRVFIGPDENSNNFHMRYSHLEPGSHSNLERHPKSMGF